MTSTSSFRSVVVVAVGFVPAVAAAACRPARIECGPGSEVFRTVDTVRSGDSLLRISRVDSLRCVYAVELEEPLPLEDSIPVDTTVSEIVIRRATP